MGQDFPSRTEAHVSESVSTAVLQECLPGHWIFRPQAGKDDYGIDAEVELVTLHGEVRGEIAKVQVKGQASVAFNGQGVAAVGGVKQPTLRYWLGLSKAANVMLCVTDNTTRDAYFTPVFWEATELLDGTSETRSIHFRQAASLKTADGPGLFALFTLHESPRDLRRQFQLNPTTMAGFGCLS